MTEHYPEVHLLALERNLGLTGGNNIGFEAAGGEILISLNNDTEAHPRFVEALVTALIEHAEAGMAAAKMLLFDRRDHIHSAGDGYGQDGIPFNRGVWQRDEGHFDEPGWIFGGCGGAVAYRRDMLDEIGMFDESFFMYCEDVDLNWRAQLAGWRCWYAPQAVVYHKLSATGGGPIASYYTGRNTLWVVARTIPVHCCANTGCVSSAPSGLSPVMPFAPGAARPPGPVSAARLPAFSGCPESSGSAVTSNPPAAYQNSTSSRCSPSGHRNDKARGAYQIFTAYGLRSNLSWKICLSSRLIRSSLSVI